MQEVNRKWNIKGHLFKKIDSWKEMKSSSDKITFELEI